MMKVADEIICSKIDRIYQLSNRVIEFYHANLQESAYHAALEWELSNAGFMVASEQYYPLWYRGIRLNKAYKIDLIADNEIILELKAKEELTSEHRLQLFNYLRLVNKKWGLLINFGPKGIDLERYYYNQQVNKVYLFDRFGYTVYS